MSAERTAATVRAEAVRIVVAMAPRRVAEPSGSTRLVEDLGYESLRLVELAIALEERFGVAVTGTAIVESITVDTLSDVERLAVALLDQLDQPAGSDASPASTSPTGGGGVPTKPTRIA